MSATTEATPTLSYREAVLASVALRARARWFIDALEDPRANAAACTARAAEYEDIALRIDAIAGAHLSGDDHVAARAELYADWGTAR